MFHISNEGNIQLVRGDTLKLALFINKGEAVAPIRYEITNNDTIYFALMELNQPFEEAILKKVFTKENSEFTEDGDLIITLSSEDTENLLSGEYRYTIKMLTVDENKSTVNTVIKEHRFYITN